MRYLHLSRNRWLDLKPEKLYSDGVDCDENVVFNAEEYPGNYRDGCQDPDKGRYRRDLVGGFYRIVISDGNPATQQHRVDRHRACNGVDQP